MNEDLQVQAGEPLKWKNPLVCSVAMRSLKMVIHLPSPVRAEGALVWL